MRFSTDDGSFGVILTPTDEPGYSRQFFRFQLIVGGVIIGDESPCIAGSAIPLHERLRRLEDSRLARPDVDPVATMDLLRTDEAFHDAALLHLAESLDGWSIRGYLHGGVAVVMGQPWRQPPVANGHAINISVVPLRDFEEISRVVENYWREASATTSRSSIS